MTNMLSITLGGKTYRLAVPTTEEAKVNNLAAHVDSLMQDIRKADPSMDRDNMWALVALQLASQATEAMGKLDEQGHSVMQFHRAVALKLEALLPQ
ncbi:MAG: cell division protein ZapA [Alphaproteobacteria bacterium]